MQTNQFVLNGILCVYLSYAKKGEKYWICSEVVAVYTYQLKRRATLTSVARKIRG